MRLIAAVTMALLLPVAAYAEEPTAATITPATTPTPTTRPRPSARLRDMPTGMPGFGVPGEPPSERPATEKPLGDAP